LNAHFLFLIPNGCIFGTGDIDKDTDIPTVTEGLFFTNPALKIGWLLCQSVFYAIRPTLMRPKEFRRIDIANVVIIVITNGLVVYCCGARGLVYLLGSSILGMGLHPVAGHFIAEHYVFHEGHETYSYYGPLNAVTWNVGYHNEHHDFPRVPGWKLPQVKAIAGEFYDHLPCHMSWSKVLWDYAMDPNMSPFSRVRRNKNDPMHQGRNTTDFSSLKKQD
jgi:sphingolipid delta-4 desaturase